MYIASDVIVVLTAKPQLALEVKAMNSNTNLCDPMTPIPCNVKPETLPADVVRARIDNLIEMVYFDTDHSSNEPRHLLPAVEELCSDFGFTSKGIPSAEHMVGDLEYVRRKMFGE